MELTFLFLGYLIFTTALTPEACRPCTCVDKPPHLTVNCSSLGLVNPPTGLPSNLTTLLLNNNRMHHINKTYFAQFPQISFLSISENIRLGLDNVSKAFYGLRNSNISIINASVVAQEYSNSRCVNLKANFFYYLRNTPLKAIYLDRNRILFIEPGTLQKAPKSLEVISMRKSRLVIGLAFLFQIKYVSNIRIFDLSERNFEEHLQGIKNDVEGEMLPVHSMSHGQKRSISSKLGILTVSLPPKLEEIIFASCYFKTAIHAIRFSNNSLKRLNLQKNIISPIVGPIYGLNKLEELDVSDSNCKSFNPQLSLNFPAPNLRYCNLSGNYLDLVGHQRMFEHWLNMTVLDVSFNKISILPRTVFRANTRLEELYLRGNVIYDFSLDISHLRRLLFLDVSQNQIAILSESTTSQLDLIRKESNLTLNLNHNPIRCTCASSSIQFIRWLFKTKVNIVHKSMLICFTDGEIKKIIVQFKDELQRQCISPVRYYGLMLGSSIALTVCICFISFGIIYRYRFKLAYSFFKRCGKRFHNEEIEDNDMVFEYDAYVAYADDDRQFAVHSFLEKLERQDQLRLCFRDRDVDPGEVISWSILSRIRNSRQIILVLSPNFLKDSWRRYEFEMAQCESVERKRSIVVLIKYKNVPVSSLPIDLLRMQDTQTYLEFPDNPEDEHAFWEMLGEKIRDRAI